MLKKSCKGSMCLGYLEKLINEIDAHQDASRSAKFNRAIGKAQFLNGKDWQRLSRKLKDFKKSIPSETTAATALQVSIDDDLEDTLIEIEDTLKKSLELKTLQTRYEIEIIWFSYLEWLKLDAMHVGDSKKNNNITGPDMVKRLVQILLLNRESDKIVIEKIKSALLEWEE